MTPEEVVSVDFETRSPHDIDLGLARYFQGAEIMMLGIKFPDMPKALVWHQGCHLSGPVHNGELLARLFEHIRAGGCVRGWNVVFEWHAWNKVGVPQLGWPQLPIEQCIDTMAQAQAMNLPGALGKCAEALGLPIQKDGRGKYLISRLCQPHKPTKKRPGIWVEDEKLFEEMVSYCGTDVDVEDLVARRTRALTEQQRRIWLLTHRINERGIPVDVEGATRLADVADIERAVLNQELEHITGIDSASKVAQLTDWLNARLGEGVVTSLAADVVEEMLTQEHPADVRRVLEIRASASQTATTKLRKFADTQVNGRIHGAFVYHGAGTGRWSSKGPGNLQNLKRPTIKKNEVAQAWGLVHGARDAQQLHEWLRALWGEKTMDVVGSCIRGALKSQRGWFVNADLASIENRVGVWLAGQWDKLDDFANGLDEYRQFSSKALHHVPYDQVTQDMRQMAKSAVLGCMFGQGALGLIEYAKGYGVTLTEDEAKEIVAVYRTEYSRVRSCWYDCANAALDAVRNPGVWQVINDKLRMIVHKKFLWLRLPSGRMIAWAQPEIRNVEVPWTETRVIDGVETEIPARRDTVFVLSVDTLTRQFMRHKLIGSSIYQSAVQGTAADILGEGALNLEEAGFDPMFLAHDEAMAESDSPDPAQGDAFGAAMCKPAPWRMDLPLHFEAWVEPRFRK